MRIAVIGTTFIDIKGYAQAPYVAAGRNAGTIENVQGGVGRNVAMDMAAAGAQPVFVSLLDESWMSREIQDRMERAGVDTRYIRRTADGLGTWLAVFDDTKDVAASVSMRPDMMPLCNILDEQGEEILARADSIAIEIDLDGPIVERTYALAEKHGKKVYALVSNMTIAAERKAYMDRTECFVCNKQEAGIFFGADYSNAAPEEMERILTEKIAGGRLAQTGTDSCCPQSMIVTMGAQGAVYASAEEGSGFVPAETIHAVDTTGAGDAFFAGTCVALTRGQRMQEACMLGTSLAARVIQSRDNVVTG